MADKTVIIEIPAGHKVGACAEQSRWSTSSVVLQPMPQGGAALLATNCKILAVLPVDAPGPDELPTRPLLLPAKACNANGKARRVEVNGEVRVTDVALASRTAAGGKTEVLPLPEQTGFFPGIRSVFPKPAAVIGETVGETSLPGYSAVCLDVKLLATLANAVSENSTVMLLIPPPGKETGLAEKPFIVMDLNARGMGLMVPLTSGSGTKTLDNTRARYAKRWEELPEERIRFGKPEAPKEEGGAS